MTKKQSKTDDLRRTEENISRAKAFFELMEEVWDFNVEYHRYQLEEDKNKVMVIDKTTGLFVKRDVKAMVSNRKLEVTRENAEKTMKEMYVELDAQSEPVKRASERFYENQEEKENEKYETIKNYIISYTQNNQQCSPVYEKIIYPKMLEDLLNEAHSTIILNANKIHGIDPDTIDFSSYTSMPEWAVETIEDTVKDCCRKLKRALYLKNKQTIHNKVYYDLKSNLDIALENVTARTRTQLAYDTLDLKIDLDAEVVNMYITFKIKNKETNTILDLTPDLQPCTVDYLDFRVENVLKEQIQQAIQSINKHVTSDNRFFLNL